MADSAALSPIPFAALPGWDDEDLALSLQAFKRSSAEILMDGRAFGRDVKFGGSREDWLEVCGRAAVARDARSFFEDNFSALTVSDPECPQGLFTGYYEPEALGNLLPGDGFEIPIYRKPPELVGFDPAQQGASGLNYGMLRDGRPAAFPSRRDIERGALAGRNLELVWLRDRADAFFIHIQGSGRIRLPDGTLLRLAYAGKNGQPYTGIGGLLAERGVLPRAQMSMQAIRTWMEEHPDDARELMWENKSFIFFREVAIDDPGLGPPGAQKVALTPERSLAVDRSLWAFGTPVWLDTDAPSGAAAALQRFRHLMIAQDTGTAIRGHVRGDVFWGAGERAAMTAGHMKSPGRMSVLLPHGLARRLLDRQ